MNATMDRALAWMRRVNSVHYIGEQSMFVSHDEYADLRDLAVQLERETPQKVVEEQRRFEETPRSRVDMFGAMPVVVDDAEAAAQLSRIGAAVLGRSVQPQEETK